MWGHRIKIRSTDTQFSKYIRSRAGWKCEVCHKDCSEDHSKLECSHYHGRGRETTRFDPDNCLSLCKTCHWNFHQDKSLHKKVMIDKLGQDRYDSLKLQANQTGKRDDEMQKIINKELLKEVSDGR